MSSNSPPDEGGWEPGEPAAQERPGARPPGPTKPPRRGVSDPPPPAGPLGVPLAPMPMPPPLLRRKEGAQGAPLPPPLPPPSKPGSMPPPPLEAPPSSRPRMSPPPPLPPPRTPAQAGEPPQRPPSRDDLPPPLPPPRPPLPQRAARPASGSASSTGQPGIAGRHGTVAMGTAPTIMATGGPPEGSGKAGAVAAYDAGAKSPEPGAKPAPSGRPPLPQREESAGSRSANLRPQREESAGSRSANLRPQQPSEPPVLALQEEDLTEELEQRAERLREADPVGAARALVELGVLQERAHHDRAAARRSYERARKLARPLEPALSRFRRLLEGRGELVLALELIEDNLRVAEGDWVRADLLAERARVCDALGRPADSREAFSEALRIAPLHAASLRGLEVVLRREVAGGSAPLLAKDLAGHLDRLADAYAPSHERPDGDARLAAWIQVERALVLDRKLRKPDLALAALEGAVSFDSAPGPVRDALRRHLVRHDNITGLIAALGVEADHERDDERASRLLYSAARLLIDKVRTPADAVELLSRAAARAPASTPTARRVLAELIRVLESTSLLDAAASVRQQELTLLSDTDAIVYEHVRLSEIYDQLGNADRAAFHAARALERHPEDASTRERLDRALQRLGSHEERVATWTAVANVDHPTPVRIAALLRAADIAERHLRRPEDAIAYLRAAWTIDPGNGAVFDALSALLSPPAVALDDDPRAVRARIDLYTQAAAVAHEPARKIGLLEKLVSIWEDELCQPSRAIEEIEKILEIDPRRRTAILALQRNAARAGDAQRLAAALLAEAGFTGDRDHERKLLLRAAEITESRLTDRDRASALIQRALALDPQDAEALRARHRSDERAGRYEDARGALLQLIAREHAGEPTPAKRDAAFALWIDVALLDERRLKRPQSAVEAYKEAARLKPTHPLPRVEIARLLRDIGDYDKLVEVLGSLADEAADPQDAARLLFQASEVQELALGRDQDALRSLTRADAAIAAQGGDTAILESMERIHVRAEAVSPATGTPVRGPRAASAAAELAALYTRWLERKPPADVDHALRIALAQVLAGADPPQAVEILQGLLGVVPNHVPALRLLEQLHRTLDAPTSLAVVLRSEADVFVSAAARAGSLWELASLEDQVGPSATLEALERIIQDAPKDTAALSAIIRVASKLTGGVGIPHPAALATRALLVEAIRASKELTADPIGRALYNLEEAILVEAQSDSDASNARAALASYRSALALWPESLLAARGLDRLAQRLGDRGGVIAAQVALAKLVHGAAARAGHLVRAAELTAEDQNPEVQARALELYEEALLVDPDSLTAAREVARLLGAEPARLADRLGAALDKATLPDAIILLGTEIGRSVLKSQGRAGAPEPGIGIAAMRRVIDTTPDDAPALLLLARLLMVQRVWAEARDVLARAVVASPDLETRTTSQFLLADLHEGPLADLPRAQEALQAILAVDAKNRLALERLHKVGVARGDHATVLHALGRLVELAPDPVGRAEAGLRFADACRDAGDAAGVVRALCDAITTAPSDPRAWTALARLYRVDTAEGAGAYAKALQQLIETASTRRLPVDPRWLTTLGLLEATILVRPREGVAHLQQAAVLPGAPPETRSALGRGLEATGRNGEAVQILRDVLTSDAETFARLPDLSHALASLEAALAKDGRADERLSVEEVRACLGEVPPERLARLRTRRLPAEAPYPMAFAGPEIARLLVIEARSPMIDIAVALAPIAAKILRFELGNLGVGSRERVSPRDGHPTRVLAERIGRCLGVEAFELYLAPTWQGAARVYPGDPPAIVASTSFIELPELEQTFALSRLFARIALGFTFLDEIPMEASDGLLLAALRCIEPTFGAGPLSAAREHAAQQMIVPVTKAIGRRQRKLIEEIYPNVSVTYDARAFTIGIRRSEYRIGYVLAGDALAAVDYLRRFDREIARSTEEPRVLLQHPVTNELMRYALTADAHAERRRAGTVWQNV